METCDIAKKTYRSTFKGWKPDQQSMADHNLTRGFNPTNVMQKCKTDMDSY